MTPAEQVRAASQPPAIVDSNGDRCCQRCQRWSRFNATLGDCRLGPPPERMWQPGVVLRMSAPDQACAAWISNTDFAAYRAEKRAGGVR